MGAVMARKRIPMAIESYLRPIFQEQLDCPSDKELAARIGCPQGSIAKLRARMLRDGELVRRHAPLPDPPKEAP